MTHEIAGSAIEDLVLLELDGALPAGSESAYGAHLAACAECQRVRVQYRALQARLGAPLPARDAQARVWAAVRAGPRAGTRGGLRAGPRSNSWGGLRAGLAAVATAVVLVLALGWIGSVRVGVAGDGLPVLYREEVGRVATAEAGDGTLAVVLKRPESAPRNLRAFAVVQLQVAAADLPGIVEIRFLEGAADAHGVLGRIRLGPEDRASGRAHFTLDAPFPPLGRGERQVYRVWVSVDGPRGERRSPVIAVEVRGEAGGQRARQVAP